MSSVITPPDSWRLKPDGSALILDGDWGFPLRQTSEEPCDMYVYEVKGFPELVKIGIAKDSRTKNWSFDTLGLHLVKRSIGREYY